MSELKSAGSFSRKVLTALIVFSFSGLALSRGAAFAEETAVNKAQDQVGDAKTSAKKTIRTAKRKVRKAIGTDSFSKDVKDKVNDVGDDISNSSEKMNRKGK